MRAKVAKKLNKLAKALMLSRGEHKKLKRDWHKTSNRNIKELEETLARVDTAIEQKQIKEETNGT